MAGLGYQRGKTDGGTLSDFNNFVPATRSYTIGAYKLLAAAGPGKVNSLCAPLCVLYCHDYL